MKPTVVEATTSTLPQDFREVVGKPCSDEGLTVPRLDDLSPLSQVPYGNEGGRCAGGLWRWIIPPGQGTACMPGGQAELTAAAEAPDGRDLVCAKSGGKDLWLLPGPVTDFYDGNYTVGDGIGEVLPGTYSIDNGPVEDCYWERVDRNGRTVENDFVTGAPTVRVVIRGTDAGFNAKRCGHWVRA